MHCESVAFLFPHLQESLQACATVLWSLSIVSVGQQADKAALAQPLGLSAGQELVKDHLREQNSVCWSLEAYQQDCRSSSQIDSGASVSEKDMCREKLCSFLRSVPKWRTANAAQAP